MIVQELNKIQKNCGYLPQESLKELARKLNLAQFRVQEVASFFPHFRLQAPPKVELLVCHDMACHLRGSAEIKAELDRRFGAATAGDVHVRFVSCLGRCDRAPAACVDEHAREHQDGDAHERFYFQTSAEQLAEVAACMLAGQEPPPPDLDRTLPGNHGLVDPYEGQPTYAAVRSFIETPDPQHVLKELEVAELRGMGGAGAPAHKKWRDTLTARGDAKYVVCNGDESEPGAFKDRELLLRTPHLTLEGVILAGLMLRATRGYIYIRHEYVEQITAMRTAIEQARRMGACGERIFGSDRSFPVEVLVSPGGYICGEQGALIEAMQDNRAQPRNKPPQLETNGLFDKPTLLSNVETFAWVPAIMIRGGPWYRDQGLSDYRGRRFFSVSGDVERPGAYEVPNGIRLGDFLAEYAGGVKGTLKAFAPSGPSGGFLPARLPVNGFPRGWREKTPKLATKVGEKDWLDLVDLPLDLDSFRALGLMLGAGVVVYNEQADMVAQALACVEFYRNESCGKCVPCRIGSQKVVEFTTNLRDGQYDAAALAAHKPLWNDLFKTMEETSICGLGAVAHAPLKYLLQYFPDEVAACLSR